MSNQYSYGCSYNYRRSMSNTDMQAALSAAGQGNCTRNASTRNASDRNASVRNTAVWNHSARNASAQNSSNGCEMDRCALAMAYVPDQEWSQPFPTCKGLQIGTIFADLNKPFCGRGGARG